MLRIRKATGLTLAIAASALASHAAAQAVGATEVDYLTEEEARDVASAARAFREGQKAQLAGEPASAAELFELADSLAPSEEALRSAIRNHLAAGHEARATTLALAAEGRYPASEQTAALASSVLDELMPKLARLLVECEAPCTLDLDGAVLSTSTSERHDVFIQPGVHQLTARFDGEDDRGVAARDLQAAEGERVALQIDAPTPAHVALAAFGSARAASAGGGADNADADTDEDLGGVPTWLTVTSLALTAVAGAATTVSYLDTRSIRDDYEGAPDRSTYARGVVSQDRTNLLLAGTGVLLATSTVLLLLTDWDGEREAPATLSLAPDGAFVSVAERF